MTNTEKTIFALSTVFGKSGVAVIRISGSNTLKTLNHLSISKKIKPRFATLVDLYDSSNQLIDNGIIIYFPAPNSFTGEDVIELQVHGSKAVIKIILEELSKIFVMAEPGEFSLRAFLNGKFDLTQIEGIADLIDAETKMQAKQALKQMSGELEKLYSRWRKELIKIQSKIEAYIDFPEDIVTEKNELEKINNEVQTLVLSMQDHLNDNRQGERLREGLHVVITGEPNVGKSTLFNFLAKRDIAIVSEYAGTTRDVLEAHIDIGGYPIILSDTAGIRKSSDPVELEGITRAKKKSSEADLRIELFPFEQRYGVNRPLAQPLFKQKVDCRLSGVIPVRDTGIYTAFFLDPSVKHWDDREIYICNTTNNDTIYVLSKADDIADDQNTRIGDIDFLPISTLKGTGTDKLISLIKEKAEEKFGCDRETPVITRQRHRNCIQKALEYLQHFDINNPIELISEDLRLASLELGIVTGIINVEEILDSIFSTFCVGK